MHHMNRPTRLVALFAAASLAFAGAAFAADQPVAAAEGPVTVTFESPEKYPDFTMSYPERDNRQDYLMTELRAHIAHQARSLLQPGQRLEVRFLEVDLAGDFEPGRHGPGSDHIRYLKEIYPPSMTLEFRLLDSNGSVISEGRRELKELGYLSVTRLPNRDSLRYDKALLTDWMRREFRRTSR